MEQFQEKGFEEKDIANANLEKRKLRDLEILQKQNLIGTFTRSDDINTIFNTIPESKEKNRRFRGVLPTKYE